ncbi:MAG: multiheme c-type cytochrome [Planctomycetota bacterium]|nr:multiheme c-type cytochrome [Planctomycetota bacterium]
MAGRLSEKSEMHSDPQTAGGGSWFWVIFFVCGVAGATYFWSDYFPSGSDQGASQAEIVKSAFNNRPQEILSDEYISSKSCEECHPNQHASWHTSYHRTMTQVASPETVIGRFDGSGATADNLEATFERRGDSFWVKMFPVGGKEIEQPVVMTTGSHHQQAYWMSTGWKHQLAMVPFVYIRDADRWFPRRAIFLKPPGAPADALHKGRWNNTCIACHTTHGDPAISTAGMQTKAAEFGIACEACHGPGENHACLHNGTCVSNEELPEDDIINPAALSHERNAEVCGQCHSTFADDLASFVSGGDQYRPGDDLWETRDREGLHKTDSQFWSDGMVRVSGREFNGLIDTPCYQRGEMTCLSCHSMHQEEADTRSAALWANDQLSLAGLGNDACLQCHEEFRQQDALTAHTHHPASSSGSFCYNCHMPHTSYGLLKAIRSPQISSPDTEVDLATGRMNACNLCHLDKTLGWTAEHLHSWYGIDVPELSEEQKSVSSAILNLLTGDAGQRAIAAWHMGWPEAQEISGTEWIAPQLAVLLKDPYDAVRYIANRSLTSLPGYEQWSFDFLTSPQKREVASVRAIAIWESFPESDQAGPRASVLRDAGGHLEAEVQQQLLRRRSDREVYLRE